jgi:uncharacterized repeat protein (TIGR02543 family)
MSRHKTKKRITAMVLSVIMVVGMMPVSALAETSAFPIGASGEITAFESLELDIAFRNVPLGTGERDLGLPETLTATLRLAALEDEPLLDSGDADSGSVASPSDAEEAGGDIEEISVALPVTWASAPEYDGEAAGTYVFMPELPEGFILTDGIELPTITLTVSEGEASVFAARGMSISLPNGTEYPETVEGLGTEEDPLRIETAAQLAALAWSVNHGSLPDSLPEYPYLILVNDLDLSVYNENEDGYGKGWVPIGGYYGGCYDEDGDIETYAFSGTFDGNHKTIRNLYVERGERYVGLFGYVKEGTVKNLTVENGDVEGYAATGGIVGALYKGQIENCVFSGSVAGEEATGGIVGDLGDSKVEDCKNTGSITGKAVTGGIVGGAGSDSENDYLRNCINTGTVIGSDAYTGGIVGLLVGMTADYCVNTGTVQGGADLNTGGVAGTISEGIIQNCVNGGPVSGSANNIGGLAGLVRTSTIRNCVNYADVSGTANSVGGVAGFAQEGSAVTNCLTTGNIRGEVNIIERGGVSGVVGWIQNGSGDANTITGCVALGQTVIKDGEMGNVARITAMDNIWDNTVSDNFAWSGMQLLWGEELIPEEDYDWLQDGENVDVATLYPLWTTGALAESWSDAGVWMLAKGKLPVLAGLPHQSDEFPSHISGIAVVMVSPDSVSVQKGATKSFTAAVSGIGTIDDTVTWSVNGAAHAGTTIDSTGMLTVAADETAETLIIAATATGDSSKKGTASVTVTDPPTVKYNLTVNSGSGSGEYAEGENVTITAAAPAENKLFDRWIVTSGTLDLSNAAANPITIRMPAEAITIGATYKDKPAVPDPTYIVTLNSGGLGATGAGSYAQGVTVTIAAGSRSNYSFTGWTTSGVTLASPGSASTTFTMPANNVTVTAGWSYTGGSGGSGDGSGSSSDSSATTPTTTTPEKKPDQPVTASVPITATAGTGGTASAVISDKTITDAIAKAQADAKAQGKTANGTSVELNVTMPQGANALTATLTPNSLNSLVNAGVTSLEINGAPVSLGLDLTALKEIQKQSGGNITISIAPATGLSNEAKKLIGNRPVYHITISYTDKDGKTHNITSLGSGTATLAIPYTPGRNEAAGYLYGVYVDGNGNVTRIPGSVHDANSRSILIPTNHFSVYGVGYEAPSAKFTDIGNHWGKEAIDYVVGRGLLSGTSKTTFAPNTAMTRGMLVTALGRLTGVDTKLYTTNSFTDVKADSAFRPYIEWARSKDIIQGIGNGQFAPDRAITREEIAVIFANYAKATGYKLPVTRTAATFADASSIGSAYKTAVTAMQQAGIMMGSTNNKFNPKQSATRAEVSAMLHRYIKLTIDPATAQVWVKNDAGQYLYYKDGKALTGTQTLDGTKHFFNTDGTLKTGWVKDGDNWRYYSGNKAAMGWLDISDKRYYFTKDGLMVSGKWIQIDGKWYYFNADGSLAKDTKVDGYEVDKNGMRKTK